MEGVYSLCADLRIGGNGEEWVGSILCDLRIAVPAFKYEHVEPETSGCSIIKGAGCIKGGKNDSTMETS